METELAIELGAGEIDARFRWARAQGQPSFPWPEVPVDHWRAALRQIESATARVLAGEDAVHLERRGDLAPAALPVAAYTSGMGGLLGYWIEAGALAADGATARLLRQHLEHGRLRAVRLEWELRRALEVLGSAGVRAAVVKGAHTARAYFPEPGTRPAADVDLVIDASAVADASAALRAAGYASTIEQRRPYKADWRPADAPRQLRSLLLNHADNPYALEVHASFERDFCGVRRVRFMHGVAETEAWANLHAAARVLPQPHLTAYLAAHASEGLQNLTLIRVVELVLVIRADLGKRLSWPALLGLLEREHALRFVYPAFALAETLAPGSIDRDLLAKLRADAPKRVRAVVDRVSPATAYRPERISIEERFMWADTPAEHLRRAARTLWPIAGGGSLRRLRRIYRDRLYELVRGNVSLRIASAASADGT